MKIVRHSKSNGSINIGTQATKLTIFTRDRCACITIKGKRIAHFGRWN